MLSGLFELDAAEPTLAPLKALVVTFLVLLPHLDPTVGNRLSNDLPDLIDLDIDTHYCKNSASTSL